MHFRWFIIIICIYLTGFFAHAIYLHKTVYGDGIYYFSWLRSAVFDHDIDFRNEFRHLNVGFQTTSIGLPGNKYSIGAPLLWFPVYFMHSFLFKGTGYELPYQLAIGATSVLYALFGLRLLYVVLSRYFDPHIARLTTIAVALGTHLLFYGSLDAVNSHAVSFFAAVLFIFFLLKKKKNWFLIGLSLGLVGLIRAQDLVYGLLIIPTIISSVIARIPPHRWETKQSIKIEIASLRLAMTKAMGGFLFAFSLQLIAWQVLYGKFWVSPYILEGEHFTLFQPNVFEVLFSLSNGLFLWTPLVVLGLVGLSFWKLKEKNWFFLVFFAQLFFVSTWSTWSQGASFSGRMFISSLPLFAFGIASLFQTLKRRGWTDTIFTFVLIGPLSLINVLLIIYFSLSH